MEGERLSKYRYLWYPNVIHAIRYYPALLQAKNDLQGQSVTANYSGMPKSGQASRTTENSAMRELSGREEEELQAVSAAIEDIGRQRDGKTVLQIIEMVDWGKTHTIDGAAMRLHMSEKTIRRKRNRFVLMVAKNFRYL
ncbi:MAG: hypothetical protein ACLSE7_07200 [Lachnospirales bacterium]